MEPLSPKARALLAAVQRSDVPTPEFRARVDRAWQRRAATLGLGAVAGTLTTTAAASGTGLVAGTSAAGSSAASKGIASLVLSGLAGKVGVSVSVVAVVGSVSYAMWLPPTPVGDTSAASPQRASSSFESPSTPARNVERIPATPAAAMSTQGPVSVLVKPASPSASPGPMKQQIPTARPRVEGKASAAPAAQSTLLEQTQELQRAHELLRDGAPEKALAWLERHSSIVEGASPLAVERRALHIAAMCRVDDPMKREQGRRLAVSFEREHTNSPLLERLKHECAR